MPTLRGRSIGSSPPIPLSDRSNLPMHIVFTAFSMGTSGVSQFILTLGSGLRALGHEVTVVTYQAGEWASKMAEHGLHATCIPIHPWEHRARHARRVADYLARGGFDVVISNVGYDNRPGQSSLCFLPETLPALVVFHNDHPNVYTLAGINRDIWRVGVAASRKVQQRAAAHFPEKPVQWIPHGIPCPSDAELRARAAWNTPLRLLFAGRLHNEQKGVLLLPDILHNLAAQGVRATLTVIGDGRDRPALEARIAAEGLADQVELRGAKPVDCVYQAMQAHHLLLFPSNYEGFGLVLAEAMVNGCVPVASHLPGVTDTVVEDGVSGLLAPPGDAAAFARQVATLADSARWCTLSREGIARAHSQFSQTAMTAAYAALLHDLVAAPTSTGQTHPPRALPAGGPFTWKDYIPVALLNRARHLRWQLRHTWQRIT